MYEYQRKNNPPKTRGILDDKRQFALEYKEFLVHGVEDLASMKKNEKGIHLLLINSSGKLVFKSADGKCGAQVDIVNCKDFTPELVYKRLQSTEYDLVEEYIIQHPDLHALSPSAVNTIRIFTQLNESDEVEILGCRLRISVNSSVDNMAAGNLAAPVEEFTGLVTGPGVYSDITKIDEEFHPVTGVNIVGFQVPFWKESIEMVKRAALKHPQNRSIGWDVVITAKGPGLIEGNHDWCKLLWQLPVKKGLKSILEKY
ncbi:sugar-transfer associated ATP-grasp domain-containing protein [Rhodonellum psychrophilum]|nr:MULTISPECIES: sugar-transfer associated ATP-grasp domain-containing protein [Rhodonellum]